MPKKTNDRDGWNREYNYKVPFLSICAKCKHFTAGTKTPTEGNCTRMDKDGVNNTTVAITALCDLFEYPLGGSR